MEFVIDVNNLSFDYRVGSFRLRIDELRVRAGEKVALTGPSGSGKSTLLNILAGILIPASGRVEVLGVDVAALGSEDRQDFRALKMGLVFQEFELLDYLDLVDNVLLPWRVSPALRFQKEHKQRAEALLKESGLGDKLQRRPGSLSQGERQRVGVCRALATGPEIIFGDEPTGNLDAANRDRIMDALFQYSADAGAALLVVTHDGELPPRFDRVIDIREAAE